jgi:hypothetical protein
LQKVRPPQNVIKNVDEGVASLKKIVKDNGLKKTVIRQLILKLSYLIKHVAFKVEQECRIVEHVQLALVDKNKISTGTDDKANLDSVKMRYEYVKGVPQHVKEIYFGPKTDALKAFRDRLVFEELKDIGCKESTNPLS